MSLLTTIKKVIENRPAKIRRIAEIEATLAEKRKVVDQEREAARRKRMEIQEILDGSLERRVDGKVAKEISPLEDERRALIRELVANPPELVAQLLQDLNFRRDQIHEHRDARR